MEGTAKVFDIGTDGGDGMRCYSSTPTIRLSPRAQIVKEKKTYPTASDPNSSPRSHHPRMLLQLRRNFSIAHHHLLHRLDRIMNLPLANIGQDPILA